MQHHTLKALIPMHRSPAIVGTLSPGREFLGKPTTNFEGKRVKSGEPVELHSFERHLDFLLSDISVRQWMDGGSGPSWIVSGVGIPVLDTIGCMFVGEDADPFETELFYGFVSILPPDDATAEISCHIAVSKDADYFALHVYKSRDEIAELMKLIAAGCRVTVSAEVECWSGERSTYLPTPHSAESQGQVLIYCKPGVPSPQFSARDIDLFVANEGTDTEGDLAEPVGDVYGELRSINRQLAVFQQGLGRLWWMALIFVAALAASGVFSGWRG